MATGRFARRHRLLKAQEFKHVFASPTRRNGRHLGIAYRANGLPTARLGLIVSKRQVKTSVARNRIKRLVRESFRQHRPALPGVDVIVIARKGIDRVENREIFEDLHHLWQHLSRTCAPS